VSRVLLHKWLVLFNLADGTGDIPVFVYAKDDEQAKSHASAEKGHDPSFIKGVWNIDAQDWLRAPGCSMGKAEPNEADQYRRAHGLARMAQDLANSYSNLAGGRQSLHTGDGPPPPPGTVRPLDDDEAEELRKMIDNLNIRHHDFMLAQGYTCDHPMQWYTLQESLANLIAQHKKAIEEGDKPKMREVLVFAFEEVLRIMNIGGSTQDYQTVVQEEQRNMN
jgi:hypothetical protein